MWLYAIRHKPSGNFLPDRPKGWRYGHTYTEPTPIGETIPRLFAKPGHAKLALRHWLAGHHTARYSSSSWEIPNILDEVDIEVKPVPSRKAEDMEIVCLSLTIFGVMP